MTHDSYEYSTFTINIKWTRPRHASKIQSSTLCVSSTREMSAAASRVTDNVHASFDCRQIRMRNVLKHNLTRMDAPPRISIITIERSCTLQSYRLLLQLYIPCPKNKNCSKLRFSAVIEISRSYRKRITEAIHGRTLKTVCRSTS